MAEERHPEHADVDHGVAEIQIPDWQTFVEMNHLLLLNYTSFIYRGQADAGWRLESTLDRELRGKTGQRRRKKHLERFQFAARGRRGTNPAKLETSNDWWALGQHHGLMTPLLDWTESPFVALYFAMVTEVAAEECAVWALTQQPIRRMNRAIEADWNSEAGERVPVLEIVKPRTDENARLVNQRGLFTRAPDGTTVEEWVKANSGEEFGGVPVLLKYRIGRKGAEDCLKSMNRMNINHATLFPDLSGASEFCNSALRIAGY